MKKFLTRGLVAVGALAIPLGASLALLPGTANAAITFGPLVGGAAPLYTGASTFCGAPGLTGGTVVGHSFVANVLNRTTGNVTTAVHVEDATPNASYVVVLEDQNCQPQHLLDGTNPVFSTDALGTGNYVFVSHDPGMTSARVEITTTDWSTPYPFASPTVPLS
jgi:hypothetical protein